MLQLLLYALAFKVILTAASDNGQTTVRNVKGEKNIVLQNLHSFKPTANITYIDKSENLLRVPNLSKSFVEHKSKNKLLKKSAKRTIQKIIKKNRSRKKSYMNQVTSAPTNPPSDGNNLDNYYAQEDMAQKNENSTTIQVNHKKKNSWNNKVSRYPMPFKKMQSMRDHTRFRRSDDREDLFILTDLDEIEFLNNDKDKDTDVVKAHVKKYW